MTRSPLPSARRLLREIFDAPSPEVFAHSLPAQSIYFAIQEQGLESHGDLIELLSTEQTRLLLDFDCWVSDQFSEERFWEWLALPDATESLDVLQKVLKSVDLKVIALMMSRHLSVQVFEEATDTPPGPAFFTPDKGRTWLHVTTEDNHQHFLFSRLIALIFETSAELFYQLLSIPGVATDAMLEEEAYQERMKRLQGEGFPDPEEVALLHSPLDVAAVKSMVDAPRYGEDTPVVLPMIFGRSDGAELVRELLESLLSDEELQCQLSFLTNCALLHFRVSLSEKERVRTVIEAVRGILNIGLERLEAGASSSPRDLNRRYGLAPIYRAGLAPLFDLRKRSLTALKKCPADAPALTQFLLEQTSAILPLYPVCIEKVTEGIPSVEKIDTSSRPFVSLTEIERTSAFLSSCGAMPA